MNDSLLNQFFAKRILKDGYTKERAQFLSSLMQVSREGHLCLEKPEAPQLPDQICDEMPGECPQKPIIRQGDRYYLQRNWVLETHILEEIARLQTIKCQPIHYEPALETLLPAQRKAVLNALENAFSIICGGPGTGKTYTAATLVRLFLAATPNARVIIAAPTGKAASHFSAVLGASVQAITLHRLLRIVPGEHKLNSCWKIDADLVIVDEASMIDVSLLASLLRSIGNETRLVLMGDPDQLPPVEAGGVFKELADLFGIRLEKSMRTDNQAILSIAETVNLGKWSSDLPRLPWVFDHTFSEKLYQKIDPSFSWEEPDAEKCLNQLNQFRVLGALRQGPFGTDTLNAQIVAEMGRNIRAGQWWTIPIMITSNHPDRDLYNGTPGVIIGKSRGGIYLQDGIAYFPAKVPYKKLPSFEIAFCLSIHKSQGSEFENVLALFPEGSENFGKEAIYTAITRAKKGIELIGQETTLKAMLAKQSTKTSGLVQRFSLATNPKSPL